MSPTLEENTIDLMLKNKPQVTIKDALSAIENIAKTTTKTPSILTLKYRVRLHVKVCCSFQ